MNDDTLAYEDIESLVANYQYNSFTSEEPYELLTEIPDEFTRQRVITAMRDKARKCGFKVAEFDKIVKAALADMKKRERDQAEKEQKAKRDKALEDIDGAINGVNGLSEKLGGNTPNFGKYICTDTAIMYVDMFGALQRVCSHPIFPTMRYVNIETGSELLNISYKLDGRWRELKLVDRKVISQARSIVSLSEYGLDITSENAKDVVNYLAEIDNLNRDIIPRRETVKRLGWVDGYGFSPYIDGVEYDSGGKFDEAFKAVRAEGSFEEWKNLAGQVMSDAQYRPARILLAASVASAVIRWTCQQPFIVHLWASESGTGKTIATMLAASVWADPEMGHYMRSMNATKVANEQLAGFCNNLPLILDELQTVKDKDFDDIIYMLAEGTGKARGSREGGLREQSRWLNTIITNGEQPISTDSRAGAVNRVISVEADGEIIPGGKEGMSAFADALRANFGHAGRVIVERLSAADTSETIRAAYKGAMSRLVKYVTGKQANYGAAILVGDALLNQIIFNGAYEDLTTNQILPYLATPDMVDTNQKAFDWLESFIAANSSRFVYEGEETATAVNTEVLGKITADGDVMIIKGALKERLDAKGFVFAAFLQWCYQRGFIFTNHSANNRHWEVCTTIHGIHTKKVPVIHFKPFVFNGL